MLVVGLTWLAWAAPIIPQRPTLPDPVCSLVAIGQVRLMVQPLPAELTREGVSAEQVTATVRRLLQDAGLQVVEDDAAAMLDCRVIAVTDPKLPEAVAYSLTLLLFQPTHIRRLDLDMFLPTYTANTIGLEPRANLRPAVEEALASITWQFLARLRQANAPVIE